MTFIRPLWSYVQKVLPTAYDDSLSYLEFLGKINEKLNEAINQINSNTENIGDNPNGDLRTIWENIGMRPEGVRGTLWENSNGNYQKIIDQIKNAIVEGGDVTTVIPPLQTQIDKIVSEMGEVPAGQTLQGQIDALDDRVTINEGNIKTNATNIETNASNIETNTHDININTQHIDKIEHAIIEGGKVDEIDVPLQTQIDNLVNNDTTINNRIDKEITDRTNADNALGARIDKEIIDRTNGDNALQGNIDEVKSKMVEGGDLTKIPKPLQTQIDESDKIIIDGGDISLITKPIITQINEETAARIAADNEIKSKMVEGGNLDDIPSPLQTQINTLDSESTQHGTDIDGLEGRVSILETDVGTPPEGATGSAWENIGVKPTGTTGSLWENIGSGGGVDDWVPRVTALETTVGVEPEGATGNLWENVGVKPEGKTGTLWENIGGGVVGEDVVPVITPLTVTSTTTGMEITSQTAQMIKTGNIVNVVGYFNWKLPSAVASANITTSIDGLANPNSSAYGSAWTNASNADTRDGVMVVNNNGKANISIIYNNALESGAVYFYINYQTNEPFGMQVIKPDLTPITNRLSVAEGNIADNQTSITNINGLIGDGRTDAYTIAAELSDLSGLAGQHQNSITLLEEALGDGFSVDNTVTENIGTRPSDKTGTLWENVGGVESKKIALTFTASPSDVVTIASQEVYACRTGNLVLVCGDISYNTTAGTKVQLEAALPWTPVVSTLTPSFVDESNTPYTKESSNFALTRGAILCRDTITVNVTNRSHYVTLTYYTETPITTNLLDSDPGTDPTPSYDTPINATTNPDPNEPEPSPLMVNSYRDTNGIYYGTLDEGTSSSFLNGYDGSHFYTVPDNQGASDTNRSLHATFTEKGKGIYEIQMSIIQGRSIKGYDPAYYALGLFELPFTPASDFSNYTTNYGNFNISVRKVNRVHTPNPQCLEIRYKSISPEFRAGDPTKDPTSGYIATTNINFTLKITVKGSLISDVSWTSTPSSVDKNDYNPEIAIGAVLYSNDSYLNNYQVYNQSTMGWVNDSSIVKTKGVLEAGKGFEKWVKVGVNTWDLEVAFNSVKTNGNSPTNTYGSVKYSTSAFAIATWKRNATNPDYNIPWVNSSVQINHLGNSMTVEGDASGAQLTEIKISNPTPSQVYMTGSNVNLKIKNLKGKFLRGVTA